MIHYNNNDFLNYKKNIKKKFKFAKSITRGGSENIHFSAVSQLTTVKWKFADKLRLLLFNSSDLFNSRMLDSKYAVKERDSFIQACKVLKLEQNKLKNKGMSNKLRSYFDAYHRWNNFSKEWDDQEEYEYDDDEEVEPEEGFYKEQKSTETTYGKLSKREKKASKDRKAHKIKLELMMFIGRLLVIFIDDVLTDRAMAFYVTEYDKYENDREIKDLDRYQETKTKERNLEYTQPSLDRLFADSKFKLISKKKLSRAYNKMKKKIKEKPDDRITIERFFEDEDLGGEYCFSEQDLLNDVKQNDIHPPYEDNDDIVLKSWFGYFETNYPILFYFLNKFKLTKRLDKISEKHENERRKNIRLRATLFDQLFNSFNQLHARGEFYTFYERRNSGLFSKLEPINNLLRLTNWITTGEFFKLRTLQDISINLWFIKTHYRYYRLTEDDGYLHRIFKLYKLNRLKTKLANFIFLRKNKKLLSESFSFLKAQKQTAGVQSFIGKNLNFLKKIKYKRVLLHLRKRSVASTPMREFRPLFVRKRKYPMRRKKRGIYRHVRNLPRDENGFFSAFLYFTLPFFLISGLVSFFSRTSVFRPLRKRLPQIKKKTKETVTPILSEKEKKEKEKKEKIQKEKDKKALERSIYFKHEKGKIINFFKVYIIDNLYRKLLFKNNTYISPAFLAERWYTFVPHFKGQYLFSRNPFNLSTTWFKSMYNTHFNRKKGFFIKVCFISFFVLLFLLF